MSERSHPLRLITPRGIFVLFALLLAMLACNVPSRPSAQSLAEAPTGSPPPIPTQVELTPTLTDTPTPTLTPPLSPSITPSPTLTATPVPTLVPTATPTTAPSITPPPTWTTAPNIVATSTNTPNASEPTATSSGPTGNLFDNPGFEGNARPVFFGEVNVMPDWEPFYCDEWFTGDPCPAKRRDTQSPPRDGYNDPNLIMGRPEYKPTDVDERVRSGKAQQWFCFFRVCQAGVFQTVSTRSGQTCEVSAWVQTWSAGSEIGTDGNLFTSWTATEDDRDNSTWFIKVDPSGDTDPFDEDLLTSHAFGYDDDHYDRYAKIEFTFTATGNKATIFFENLRLWPFPHNDSYIDDASIICE